MSKYRVPLIAAGLAGQFAKNLYSGYRAFNSVASDGPSQLMAPRPNFSFGRGKKPSKVRVSFKSKSRRGSKTQTKKKRKFKSKSRRLNNKRNYRFTRRIQKASLATQPYWIDTATMNLHQEITGPRLAYLGLAPIGVFSGVATVGDWPYPNTSDGNNQYSDLTRIGAKIGVWNGATSTMLDQGQKIMINYSKVQYMLRNNANIAVNFRIFRYKTRLSTPIAIHDAALFARQMLASSLDAGVSIDGNNPLTHPTDFPWFNKNFKITRQQNIRLLPGEMTYLSDITLVNKVLNSNQLNSAFINKNFAKFIGIMAHGDPVHDSFPSSVATLSNGAVDIVATYKLKFRRLDVPTLQNKIYLDNDLPHIEDQHHTAAFSNVPNIVQF